MSPTLGGSGLQRQSELHGETSFQEKEKKNKKLVVNIEVRDIVISTVNIIDH